MKKLIPLVLSIIFIYACSNTNVIKHDYTSNTFDITYIKSNLEFLASDYMQGRDATSNSEKIASQFIAGELNKYGLEPFGDDGTYFQNISFKSRRLNENSNIIVYGKDSRVTELKLGDEIATQAYRKFKQDCLNKKLPLVFAGYGIVAEEYGYDDYTYIDPKDKIVIVLPGEPYSESEEFFEGDKRSKYSSAFTKTAIAEDKGAAGVLIIPSDEYMAYWNIIAGRATKESLQLDIGHGDPGIPVAMISPEAVKEILADQETSYEAIEKTIEDKEIPEAFELDKQASINLNIINEEKQGRNVVAILPGNNPELKNEYVTIGAHYDHVGVTEGEVYNGADDNGSGTTAVLETARLLSAKQKNERPIVFLFYTAEEKGLLGSEYFVSESDITDKILVNINVDMTGRGSVDSIFCIGSDRVSNEFDELIRLANKESVNYFLDYSLSHTRLFRQSDQYSYAEKDIPVVFFFDNMREDLHKPGDDVDKINFNKICKTAHLASKTALEVSNLDHKLVPDKTEE